MASVVISSLILFIGLTNFGPLDPPTENTTEHISQVATLSASISNIFALMVGAIAIIAVIAAERAETKATEQLKVDISRLWMALHSLRNRGLLYTSPEEVRTDLDLFEAERSTLSSVLNGPTGFSMTVWQAKHSSRDFGTFTADLAGILNLLTLKTGQNPQGLFNTISIRANKTADLISNLTDKDISQMSSIVRKMGAGLDQARSVAQSDVIADFIREFDKSSKSQLPPPTQEQVNALADKALNTIGGKADETVKHFGERAINGNEEDVARWHELVSKLGL
ncbi:hypothetical protein [Alteromonas gracilis]|uniref:hypothetical protein n=1 Tax=Alteromonas gracilis TaxID=1479524 RepID=UPI003735D35F